MRMDNVLDEEVDDDYINYYVMKNRVDNNRRHLKR